MWSTPVTLGGGITMVYGSFPESELAWKNPLFSQYLYHLSSTSAGLYFVDRDMLKTLKEAQK
jgi:hypothetical protein